jgi:hypothetical protein
MTSSEECIKWVVEFDKKHTEQMKKVRSILEAQGIHVREI